jgi:hypothetical protein
VSRVSSAAVADRNFNTHELPRFAAVPRIETLLISNDDVAPQGARLRKLHIPIGKSGLTFNRSPLVERKMRA